jgi:hypothetical protein
MSPTQKVIKYVAMAFAIGLMVTILSSILLVVTGVSQSNHLFATETDYIDFTKEFSDVENLDISNYSGKIYVQPGNVDQIVVDAKNVPESLTAEMTSNRTLLVEDDDRNNFLFSFWFFNSFDEEDTKITIIIPNDIYFESVEFDNGSGSMELSGIKSKSFYLDGGSGGIIISDVSSEKAEISSGSGSLAIDNVNVKTGYVDSGSGAVRITNSAFADTEFETGSGALSFAGTLTGESSVNSDSGGILIELTDRIDSYDVALESGSGGIWVNGVKCDDEDINNNNAENELSIEGGSGKVTINFAQ